VESSSPSFVMPGHGDKSHIAYNGNQTESHLGTGISGPVSIHRSRTSQGVRSWAGPTKLMPGL